MLKGLVLQGFMVLPVARHLGLSGLVTPLHLAHGSYSARTHIITYYIFIQYLMQTLKTRFVIGSYLEGFYGLSAKPKPSFLGKERRDEKDPLLLQPSAIL